MQAVNIGIDEGDLKEVAGVLSRLLADTYTLYLKTHNFHWNVTGPMFHSLHVMFEEQYNELAVAVDDIAERIRTIGYPAPGSYSEYAKLTSIQEDVGVSDAKEMVRLLVEANEAVIRTARSGFDVADSAGDESTLGLLGERLSTHEKAAWMLRSML